MERSNLLKRFFRYISIDTTSDSSKEETPSSEGQRELAQLLIEELEDLNLDKIYYDEKYCYVYGKLKGNKDLPKIGFVAHLDTSEDASGKNVKPKIISDYNGEDIALNDEVILSTKMYPSLKEHVGKTIITTSGDTLLGADNKAGIAEIMTMLEYFSKSKKEHGDIYICFTPDEEIGLGTLHLDNNYFCPDFAYTIDGGTLGEFSYENFNAANAYIEITGVPIHCGSAKGIMINAGRVATILQSMMPNEIPENTENYEGFFHLEEISGNVAKAKMKYLIRDFDEVNFEKRKELITSVVDELNKKYNNCIQLKIKDSYKNMLSQIKKEPELINGTISAISSLGINPQVIAIRGGTDGTEISFNGIPCPNIGVGAYNFHGVHEYACIEEMEKTSELLIAIVNQFSRKKETTKNR